MPARPIVTIPDQRLYTPSDPVVSFDRKLRDLVRDMYDSMATAGGVGLAAVQIGVMQRVLVIDLLHSGYIRGAFVNPRVIESSPENQDGEEGCLSVPGLFAPLLRPKWVRIAYQDLSGHPKELLAQDYLARAVLHEMDHLDGKVFIDALEPDLRLSLNDDIETIRSGGKLPGREKPDRSQSKNRKERRETATR